MVKKRQTILQLSVLNIMLFYVSVDSCIIFILYKICRIADVWFLFMVK